MTASVLVLCVLCAFATVFAMATPVSGDEQFKYVCAFSGPSDIDNLEISGGQARWSTGTEDGAKIEGTAFETTQVREGALYLVLLPGEKTTSVGYSAGAGMPADWSGFDLFTLHFENGSEFMINLHLTVTDKSGATFFADNLWIFRSKNRIALPTSVLRTADGDALDLANIASFKLDVMSEEKFERDLWLYRIRLEKDLPPVVENTDRRMLIDCAPMGAATVPGAKVLSENTEYAAWRGYGWTSSLEPLTSVYFRKPEGLTGDWVWADVGGEPAKLRVDLPDGKYKARFYGGNYNEKVVAVKEFSLAVDGREVASRSADPDTYYTTDGHFFGLDLWYEDGEDPYAKFVAPYYQTYDFDFAVAGGNTEFAWTGVIAAFGILIAPAEGREFADAVAAVEASRSASVHENLVLPEKPSEPLSVSADELERGFVLWKRSWLEEVGIFDQPHGAERDPAAIRLKAAQGERVHGSFTVTPVQDLGEVEVAVSDLAGADGAVVPSSAVQVRVVRYMWQGWPAELSPAFLYPCSKAPAPAGINRTFWLTLSAPADAPGGSYAGEVTIKTTSGGEAVLPVKLDVRPFSLIEDHDVSYAWWRTSDYNMNYMLKYFLPGKMDYFRRLLDAEAAGMKAHGCTGYYFNPPIITGVEGEKVKLDFTIIEEEAKVAKKYGFCDKKRPGMVFLLPDVARYLMKETRYGDYMEPEDLSPGLPESEQLEEFSDLFNARYIDAARQIHEFFVAKGLSVLLYPSDEPRERNTNRWNRNLADTIRYCKLIHDNIPGARVYVDPMRDDYHGTDYISLCDNVEVIGTHPWDQSSRTVARAGNESPPELWYFNAIMWDRYDFGLEVAAADAKGFWQWHLKWDWVPFQPFHPGFKWGVTLPGPEGPFDKANYEMVALAINDYRYIATLEERVETAREDGSAANAVASAEKTLAAFYDAAPPYPTEEDYRSRPRADRNVIGGKSIDQWRDAFAQHIEEIDAEMEP